MNKDRLSASFAATHYRKRLRKEKRFRLYGRLAIGFSLLALALLLATVLSRGWQGFLRTEIRLDVPAIADVTSPDALIPSLNAALAARFPGVTERRDRLSLENLLSSGASYTLRDALVAHPERLRKAFAIWLPASDMVDRAVKSHVTAATPAAMRRIPDRTLGWLTSLQQAGAVRTGFNLYFFRDGDSREPEMAGFGGSMMGSLFTLLSCMLAALPIGVMAAMYLEEFAKKTTAAVWLEVVINNLAAVPSIVFGLLGLEVYLGLFGIPRSASIAGGLTLALMILPTIIIATRASLRAIPDSIRDAARGLGASPMQVVLHHTLPLSVPGIMTGAILGVARAMGETAPLLMIGMVAFVADVPRGFTDAATAMPVQIYLWATSPEPSFVEKTAAGIIVLLVMLIIMNSLAILVRRRFERQW